MPISAKLLPEFDQEMAATRRIIERVPTDKGQWKPHTKSFSIGHLAQLLAGMPGWLTSMLTKTKLDLAAGPAYSYQTTDELLAAFDRNVSEARAAIESAKDADYERDWSLTMGDKVLMTTTRETVVRQTISHLSHHRGQMTVYLRLLDVPVPSIYGPTADDRGFMG
jgi:uncharacterized damage-inducible protein DinB